MACFFLVPQGKSHGLNKSRIGGALFVGLKRASGIEEGPPEKRDEKRMDEIGDEGGGCTVSRPCRNVGEIACEVRRAIEEELAAHPEDIGAGFYFRGEKQNYATRDNSEVGTHFPCNLYQPVNKNAWKYERRLYEEALRGNVIDFYQDRTMTERVARMQHYQLPTRFNDLTENALQAAFFATGAGSFRNDGGEDLDGWIRVVKVARHKMKSFTSDIIVAISHLPLVDPGRFHLDGPIAKSPEDDGGLNVLRYEIMKERPAFGFEHERPKLAMDLRRDIRQVWAFKPMLNTARIRKQGGIFLAVGCGDGKKRIRPTYAEEDYDNPDAPSYGIKQIAAIRIAAGAKKALLEELRYFGIRAENTYPELGEVCQKLAVRLREEYAEME